MSAPKIVNLHFTYIPGPGNFGKDKGGQLDSTHSNYHIQIDNNWNAFFFIQFDQELDAWPINTLVWGGTFPVGIVDLTQIYDITGENAWKAGVQAAGYTNHEWWLHYDDVHNLKPVIFNPNDGLGVKLGGNLNQMQPVLSSSVLQNHCTFFQLPYGKLKPGHKYAPWYIPGLITAKADGASMPGSPPGEPANKATWYSDNTELIWVCEGTAIIPDNTPPEIVSITPSTGTNLTAYEGKDVQVNSSLAIKFSEDVTIASNAFYFSKEVDRASVYSNQSLGLPYTISYDSSTYTATFTPNSPLEPGVKYVIAHYTSNRTQDSAGNSLYSNSFTSGYEFTTHSGTPGVDYPPYDYSYYGTPASWTKIGCVSLPVQAVQGASINNSTTNPIPAGNYVSGEFEIILENSALADFQSIFQSLNSSGAIPDPVWILDAAGYSTQTANFWNWWSEADGKEYYPTSTMGSTGGYALGARIPGAKPGLITWKWHNTGIIGLTLKGDIQVDRDIPYDGWNLEMCLLKFNAFTGSYLSVSDSTAPTIVSQTPAPGATNVSVNTPITITFDEELDLQASRTHVDGAALDTSASAINAWISEGATYTYASKVLTITPTNPLPTSTAITVAAPSGIKDLAGNVLVTPVGWQFTTAAPTVAPNLVRMYFFYPSGWSNSKTDLHFDDLNPIWDAPEDLGTAGTFVFEFDKPIDSGTAQKYSTSSGGMFATTPFVGVTDYTAIINGPGPIAYAGSNGGRWWEVYDQYNIEPFGKDITGVGVYPFNLSNIHSSLNAPAYHCLYFTAKVGAFLQDHEYRPYIIPSLLTDTSNIPLGSNIYPEFTFNGRVLKWKISDSVAPTIVSITPAPGATNVPVNTPITIEFSEELDPASRLQTWVLHPSSQTYSSKVLTITPTSPWPGTTTINVTSPTGPILTDMSGNPLAAISWSFTTAAPPDTRVPIEAYAYGFSIDPDQFKSIPLTKSGSIDIDFKIPADDIDGSKIMYLRLRDENGLISPNYRISLRVNDVDFKTFEIDSDPYLIGSVNNVDVRFDIDDTDVSGFQYGYLVDDSSEPTTWASPVITTNSINEYLFNFNLDVSTLIAGEHELYVWIKTKEGEKRFRKTNFVSEPAVAPPYGTIGIKRSLIEDGKKKVWVEANVFDDGVGVKELSLEDTAYPDNLVNINIIQNKRYLKIFEYDALDNSLRNYKLILVDAIGTYNATPITTTVDLSSVF